jgi:hypothetical protein
MLMMRICCCHGNLSLCFFVGGRKKNFSASMDWVLSMHFLI